jgi:hypothetical protein
MFLMILPPLPHAAADPPAAGKAPKDPLPSRHWQQESTRMNSMTMMLRKVLLWL